jgi:hypothetical protein
MVDALVGLPFPLLFVFFDLTIVGSRVGHSTFGIGVDLCTDKISKVSTICLAVDLD